nr:hypothetical protein CFP56_34948 [Quercus suber]
MSGNSTPIAAEPGRDGRAIKAYSTQTPHVAFSPAVVPDRRCRSLPCGTVFAAGQIRGSWLSLSLSLTERVLTRIAQTVYIYLGVAALTGITAGLAVSYVYRSLHSTLRLGAERSPRPTRTAKEYREAKRKQQTKAESPLMSPSTLSPRHRSPDHLSLSDGMRRGQRARGLLNQTIMEEVDSDF